ncbi:Histone deacetylase complex subunit SAP18 Sin3-associated polypeptide [Vigna angularis]|uniref:Histone deacetylase complex subunit SAP18 Sin3-associated polypeptide n=1 Tax=Phaseolus angularis TaxID=3914 RepID=A0A8T0JQB4_PHAAN|nr:Histone deacetylase complex subunit SAP18 Sin3-associated polypeptide [Vigna angularis]
MEDFAVRGKEPKDEVQIYTWKDATLRELTDLVIAISILIQALSLFSLQFFPLSASLTLCFPQVKEVAPPARRRNAKLSFAFVFPDKNGRFKVQECRHKTFFSGLYCGKLLANAVTIVDAPENRILWHCRDPIAIQFRQPMHAFCTCEKKSLKDQSSNLKTMNAKGVGKTLSYGNGRLDDGKALAELGFEIGDYLDVAIL